MTPATKTWSVIRQIANLNSIFAGDVWGLRARSADV
jgi:hypothetical protein